MTAATTGAGAEVGTPSGGEWVPVCRYDELTPGRGVAALVGGDQVAVFRDRAGNVYAVGNQDPLSGAYVMARGIMGSRSDIPTVASPMYKQAFDLRTGRCLDDESAALPVYPVRVCEGAVHIARG
jgi:nitrite reductase (NADH) small subunit